VARFAVNKIVMRFAPQWLSEENLPEELAEVLPHVPLPVGVSVWAMVCKGRSCMPPITDPEALLEALERGD
jgi:hypothetical protein